MFTTNEVAEMLDVTPVRVRQMVATGIISAEKRGRDLMIAKSEIEKAKARKTKPGPKAGKLINPSTGQHQCPVCGQEWWANIKPLSGGRYYRGGKQCPNGCTSKGKKGGVK